MPCEQHAAHSRYMRPCIMHGCSVTWRAVCAGVADAGKQHGNGPTFASALQRNGLLASEHGNCEQGSPVSAGRTDGSPAQVPQCCEHLAGGDAEGMAGLALLTTTLLGQCGHLAASDVEASAALVLAAAARLLAQALPHGSALGNPATGSLRVCAACGSSSTPPMGADAAMSVPQLPSTSTFIPGPACLGVTADTAVWGTDLLRLSTGAALGSAPASLAREAWPAHAAGPVPAGAAAVAALDWRAQVLPARDARPVSVRQSARASIR